MKNKLIIWDWNGTLLDDVDLCLNTINHLLKEYNLSSFESLEHYRDIFSFPVKNYYAKMGFDFEQVPFSVLAKKYIDVYQPSSFDCSLHDGAYQVLQNNKDQGYRQIVLSASQIDYLKEQIAIYDIDHYFDCILGIDNIHAASKVELAKKFFQMNELNANDVIFIGDSVHDHEVASEVGCQCILIAAGHQSYERLKETGTTVLHDISELPSLLATL